MKSAAVIVITGPTATGKTELSVRLAERMGGEIVGADSMQIYQYMNIGTAKPLPEEMHEIPHHMIDCVSPFESYSVSRYVEDARKCIEEIFSRGKIPFVVGGTGLYIESLLSGRSFAPEGENREIRQRLEAEYDQIGGEAMREKLRQFDKESAEKLHPNDKKRIVRAMEVYEMSGKPISQHNAETTKFPPLYQSCRIALNFCRREDLYNRIDSRVDNMLRQGLQDEVDRLLRMGLTEDHTAMQAIGYKEMVAAVQGKCSIDQAVEKIKQESRRYAKRQLSWLRRDSEIHWICWDKDPNFVAGERDSTNFLEKSGILKPYK